MSTETGYSIEIDCAPFTPRPDEYIEGLLEDTGLEVEDFDTGPPFFGCQTWILKNKEKTQAFINAKPRLKERITALYNAGRIRYGSW